MAKTTIINVTVDSKINTAYVTYSTGTEKLYPANKLPKTVQAWLDKSNRKPDQEIVRDITGKHYRVVCRHNDGSYELEWLDGVSAGGVSVVSQEEVERYREYWKEFESEEEPNRLEPEPEEKIDLGDDSQVMYLDLYAEGATWHPVDGAVEGEPETVEEVVKTVDEAVEEPVRKQYASSTQADLPAVAQKPELTVPDNSMGAAEAVAFGVTMAMAIAFWGIVGMIQILMAGIEVLWTLARPRAARLARAAVRSLPTVTTKKGLAVVVRVLPVLVGIMALM